MNRVQVDLQALQHNYENLTATIGANCQLMAVVKADGYGHGMVEAAKALQQAGAEWFGVGTTIEGKRLRSCGITGRIVVLLGGCGLVASELVQYQLEPVVSSGAQLASLLDQSSAEILVHLKVDCGMGRLGFFPDEVGAVCAKISGSSLRLASLLSHFPVADEDLDLSLKQAALFHDVVTSVRQSGMSPLAHMANSAAVVRGLVPFDLARTGIGLYGYSPVSLGKITLEPVMRVTSRVLQVKSVQAGTGISYGLTETTTRDSILAVIGMGYADGFPRTLSGCGQVLVGGQFAKIIGRVCMNMTVVDVTDIDAVNCGDEVVIIGRQGVREISATDIATWAGTINYEILCALGNLNPREYV